MFSKPNPAMPEMKIEDLWFRFALSIQSGHDINPAQT